MPLTDEERTNIKQDLQEYPDWGGAEAADGGALEIGKLTKWNGALWVLLARGGDYDELWLAPLCGVRRRPEIIEDDASVWGASGVSSTFGDITIKKAA